MCACVRACVNVWLVRCDSQRPSRRISVIKSPFKVHQQSEVSTGILLNYYIHVDLLTGTCWRYACIVNWISLRRKQLRTISYILWTQCIGFRHLYRNITWRNRRTFPRLVSKKKGRKCTMAASLAAPWWVTLSMSLTPYIRLEKRRDKQTDWRQTITLRLQLDAAKNLLSAIGVYCYKMGRISFRPLLKLIFCLEMKRWEWWFSIVVTVSGVFCCAYQRSYTLRRARLALRRVTTVPGFTVLVCNQPLRPTQPPTLGERGMNTGSGQWHCCLAGMGKQT